MNGYVRLAGVIVRNWFWRGCAALWALLPDKCQMPGCTRHGVRGNENVIHGFIVCDYCHAKHYPRPTRDVDHADGMQ